VYSMHSDSISEPPRMLFIEWTELHRCDRSRLTDRNPPLNHSTRRTIEERGILQSVTCLEANVIEIPMGSELTLIIPSIYIPGRLSLDDLDQLMILGNGVLFYLTAFNSPFTLFFLQFGIFASEGQLFQVVHRYVAVLT
jgi:hypothetical protein